ncbi:MAG TPA: ComEC/Rec2 family competence protein [Bryobacteraceae bacterium]|nr:ComEC/Rec2 family competence protein [Bryobacteraceae bacterium]
MKQPLLAPLVSLALGIVLSRVVGFRAIELLVCLPLFFAITLLAYRRSTKLGYFACLGTLVLGGAALELLHRPSRAPRIDASSHETVVLSGCVVSPPAFYGSRDQFVVELARKARARVSLAVKEGEKPPDLYYGQIIELEARVRPIRNFQNPGAFDYEAYSARSDIYWTASMTGGGGVKVLPGRCGSRFQSAIFRLRTAALDRIDRLYAGKPYDTGMMEATLIGESSKLDRIWTEEFRRSGTYHMLVIDGLHITVLAAFLLFLLRICFMPELAALAMTAAGAWLYALVSGCNAPAVRAAGGFTLYLFARYFYRRGRVLNLLAAMAIVYLACDPGQLFEAGFQLSFLAVAAIGALAIPVVKATSGPFSRSVFGITEVSRDARLDPKAAQFRVELRLLAETLYYCLRIPKGCSARGLAFTARLLFYAWEMAVISTVIQIALALPLAIYFHRISFTGFSANIIVVPLLALVVPVGFVAVFTGWHFPAILAGWLLGAGEKVAAWHVRFEPDWRVPDPPLWLAFAFSAALIALAFAIWRSRQWSWVASGVVAILFGLVFWHPFPPDVHRGELELTAIDVGQGDSLLLSFPDGKLMLVDGGGTLSFGQRSKPRIDIGEDVVSPYLWRRSIRKIDVVVMTHAHDDHAQGLPALIENFHPAELWTGATAASEAWTQVASRARLQKVSIMELRAGKSFDFGGAHIEIVSPPPDYEPGASPKNNDSLAMRITYGKRSILLTGDMEKPMEIRALAEGEALRADILKVGHHGSNTSSIEPFLDAVSPTFAVISDGFENSFRHPHPQVLARLSAHRATILRTDLVGLTTVRTDGHRVSVETFLPRAASHETYQYSAAQVP